MDSPVVKVTGGAGSLAGGPPGPAGTLCALLTLEAIEEDEFRASGSPGGDAARLYGGQVAAQALAAAGNTATGARPHSLHAYFLRPGDSSRPVLFRVDRLQDGRTFRRRRVTAIQQGQPILCLESSFTTDGSGADDYPGMPTVPGPEDCPVLDTALFGARPSPWALIEARTVPASPRAGAWSMWFRFRAEALAQDAPPEAVVTYLSDLTLAGTTKRSTKRQIGRAHV